MTRRAQYQAGLTHGHRLAQDPNVDHEPVLRLEVKLTDGGPARARALGELRGYRQAVGRPYVEGHRVHPGPPPPPLVSKPPGIEWRGI